MNLFGECIYCGAILEKLSNYIKCNSCMFYAASDTYFLKPPKFYYWTKRIAIEDYLYDIVSKNDDYIFTALSKSKLNKDVNLITVDYFIDPPDTINGFNKIIDDLIKISIYK